MRDIDLVIAYCDAQDNRIEAENNHTAHGRQLGIIRRRETMLYNKLIRTTGENAGIKLITEVRSKLYLEQHSLG